MIWSSYILEWNHFTFFYYKIRMADQPLKLKKLQERFLFFKIKPVHYEPEKKGFSAVKDGFTITLSKNLIKTKAKFVHKNYFYIKVAFNDL